MMSMTQPVKKRRHPLHLVIVYTIMTIIIVAAVTVLVLVLQGYRYNQQDGKLEQGGLVQFDSRPSGATVSVDGIGLANKTASKITLTSGQHTIMMSRDGYGSWTHDATVKPGGVLWLNYTLLFPNKPVLSTAASYPSVPNVLPSPDDKRMAATVGTSNTIEVTTLDTDNPETAKVTIPADTYTAAAEGEAASFTPLAWDRDSKFLLVRYTHGNANEYLSVNTQDGATHNISRDLGVNVLSALYSQADSSVVYLLTATHELRRANLSNMTLSGPLANNVSTLSMTEKDMLLYATSPDEKGMRTISYLSNGASKGKVITSYPNLAAEAALDGITGTYYGDHYVILSHDGVVDIKKGTLPNSESADDLSLAQVATMPIEGGANYIGFSSDSNRIIYAQHDATVVTYDLELGLLSRTTLPAAPTRRAEWLDGYHMATTVNDTASYQDYDGTNGVNVATNVNNLPMVLSSGNKYIYYFVTTGQTTKLMRAKMTA